MPDDDEYGSSSSSFFFGSYSGMEAWTRKILVPQSGNDNDINNDNEQTNDNDLLIANPDLSDGYIISPTGSGSATATPDSTSACVVHVVMFIIAYM
jgi:hypothetical protein